MPGRAPPGSAPDAARAVPGGSDETVPYSVERESDLYDSFLQRVAGAEASSELVLAPPTVGSVLGGKYRIEAALGRGGMGFVFRARHAVTGRAVALKWMLPRYDAEHSRLRFVREAQAIGRIRHPNVVDIYDVESADGATYLVMELLEGETLRDRLKRGRLETTEAVDIVVPLLSALRAAHRQGVIHRDLKPENIFLARDEAGALIPKVLDFGISTFAEGDGLESGDTITKTGQFVGTPVYTALERLRENQPFDHRVDVYSMGVILYEALTGQLPFAAHSVSELTFQLATSDPTPAREHRRDLSPALESVVMQALARDASARPSDAESFAKALADACPGSRGLAFTTLAPAPRRDSIPQPEPRRRSRAPAAAAGLVALVALMALAVWSRNSREDAALRASVNTSPKVTEKAALPSEPVPPIGNPAAVMPAVEPSTVTEPSPVPPSAPRSVESPAAPPGTRTPSLARSTAAPSGTAALTVVALPYGNVWIDGRKIGGSPVTLNVPSGGHVVAVGRDAPERENRVTLGSGEARRVVLSLKP